MKSPTRPPTPYPIFRKKTTQPAKDEEEKSEVVEYAKEMLQKSMLTGVPQIVTAPTTRSKVFKSFVVMGSFTGFLYQTSAFLVMYFSYPTLVDVQVTTPPFVDVPSMTICNKNGLRRRAYCDMKPNNCDLIDIPKDFCHLYPESCEEEQLKGGNMFPKEEALSDEVTATQEEIEEVGHDVYPLVSSCEFRAVNITFDYCQNTSYKSFIFQDLYGRMNKCYIINALWSKASLNLPRVPTRASLELIVDLEPDEYFALDRPLSGQLAIHSPWNILNPFSEGVTIKPNKMYIIQLKENIKNLLPRPYQTNCTDYIAAWKSRGLNGPLSKEVSVCPAFDDAPHWTGRNHLFQFFSISRRYGECWSDWMCIEECILNQTMDNCKCVLTENLYPHNFKFCGRETDFCTNSVNYTHCFVKCSPACHDRNFAYTMKEEELMTISEDKNTSRKINWNRTVKLMFLFKRTEVNIYRYRAKYESIELFSFLGGFVGIWLGVSLIALLDFLESLATFCVFLFDRLKTNRRISTIGSAIGSRLSLRRSSNTYSEKSIPWAKDADRNHLRVQDLRRGSNGHY